MLIVISHVLKTIRETSSETLEADIRYSDSQGLEHLCLAEPASCPYFSEQSSVIAVNQDATAEGTMKQLVSSGCLYPSDNNWFILLTIGECVTMTEELFAHATERRL